MTEIHRIQTRFTECGRIRTMRVPFSQLQQPQDLSGRVLGHAAAQEADIIPKEDHAQPLPQVVQRVSLVPFDGPGELATQFANEPQRLLSTARGRNSILSCSQQPVYFLTILQMDNIVLGCATKSPWDLFVYIEI